MTDIPQEVREAAALAEAEALTDGTGDKGDVAYNLAVEHIAQAIRSEANG